MPSRRSSKSAAAAPLFGWKIAATSAAGQAHINVDGPLAGRLLREKAFASGATCRSAPTTCASPNRSSLFAWRAICRPRADTLFDRRRSLDAIDALHPAIELPDSRYEDFCAVGAAQLIADNACAHLFVLGDPAPEIWRGMDLARHTVARQRFAERSNGKGRGRTFWPARSTR